MTKKTEWVAPIFLVVGIFAIWLSLTYLPLSSFGLVIPTDSLWLYMPWLIVLGIALYILKELFYKK
jgi:hypothetical protein